MSGATVRCNFPLSRKRSVAALAAKLESDPGARPASKVAQMLALAHYIEQSIDSGVITFNADAARALGLTRARMTQIMNLLLLSPEIQARILTGTLKATERGLRAVVKEPGWEVQATNLPTPKKTNE